jgi:hypothetical protein
VNAFAIQLSGGGALEVGDDPLDQPLGASVDHKVHVIGHDGAGEGTDSDLGKDRPEASPDGAGQASKEEVMPHGYGMQDV